jgi:hypothetical protein
VAWVFRTAKNAAHKLKVGRTADVIFLHLRPFGTPPPAEDKAIVTSLLMQDYNVPRRRKYSFFSPPLAGVQGVEKQCAVFRTAKNAAHNLKVGRTTDVIFSPPPSLRDTSASGGYLMVIFIIPLRCASGIIRLTLRTSSR